jgi:hypothetical protein
MDLRETPLRQLTGDSKTASMSLEDIKALTGLGLCTEMRKKNDETGQANLRISELSRRFGFLMRCL